MKPLFLSRPSKLARLIVVALASVALMTTDHKGQHLESLRGILVTFVYPLQYAVDLPIQALFRR